MKRINVLQALVIISLIFVPGCIKDDLTKPADLNLAISIPAYSEAESFGFNFWSGYMAIESVSFEGIREGGTTISFESDFDDLIISDLYSTSILPEFRFNIPQGSFSFLKFLIEIEVSDFENIGIKDIEFLDEFSLVIFGDYTDYQGIKTPLIFLIDEDEIFSASVRSQDPTTTITLQQGITRTARFEVDPYHAFKAIPSQSMNQAARINIDGIETILISQETNSTIYAITYLRILNSCILSIQ